MANVLGRRVSAGRMDIEAAAANTYHFTEQFENVVGESSKEEEACPVPCKTIFARDLFGPVMPSWRARRLG